MMRSDKKLLKAFCSTSQKKMEFAFHCFYQKYAPLLFYLALKEVRHKEDAEDIVSMTFLRFFEYKNKITNGDIVKYYLTTICKNLCRDLKKEKEKTIHWNPEIETEEKNKDDYEERIEQFKKFLTEEEIEIIVLHTYYGFTFKEIAEEKNVSQDAISSKYYRAIKKIKLHYRKEKKDA